MYNALMKIARQKDPYIVTRHSPEAFQDPAGMLKKFYQRQPLTFSDEEPLRFRRSYSL
jgi:hypothetical protein